VISKWIVILFLLFLLYLGILYAPPKYVQIETTAMTLSPHNTDEYGTSNFVKMLNSMGYHVVYGGPENLTHLGNNDIYVLIGPDIPLSQDEVMQVKEFLGRGGSILVADELGTVNNLLTELFKARISEDYTALYWNFTLRIEEYVSKSQIDLSIYPTAYACLDVPPTNFYREIYQSGVDSSTFFILIYKHKSYNPVKSIMVYPNLPGYIEDPGVLNISGLMLAPKPDYLKRVAYNTTSALNIALNDVGVYIYSAYYEDGDSRAYIVSDTSIFTNNEFTTHPDIASFYKNLFEWLNPSIIHSQVQGSQGFGVITASKPKSVLIDIEHYKPNIIKQPLPPPGAILNSILAPVVENISPEQIYNFFNDYIGVSAIFILGVPLTIIGIYLYLVKYLGVSTKRIEEPEIMERITLSESLTLKMIRGGRREKRFYKDMIHGLYEYLDHLFLREYRVSLLDISKGEMPGELKIKLGDKGLEEFNRLVKRIISLELKIRENRRLPIVYSWSSTFKKLIVSTDNILKILGYEFMYPAEGLKKIEYFFR